MSIEGYFFAIIGGFLWGITTSLMKRFSNPLNQIDWSRRSTQSFDTVRLILQILFTNPKFVICFLFNQLGSVFFNLSLAYNPLTTTVPISNTLNFAVIALFGCFYEGVSLNKDRLFNLTMLFLGVILCSIGSI
ncbi:Transmembrane protein 234 [Sarcoptes scabiei]|nr:Transmembrane protein 234 [Sarcoptes scabiei]